MLKNIDALLTPDLLAALARMGHGDVAAVVDRNFPAARGEGVVVELPETGVVRALEAVLSVLPLDTFSEAGVWHMLTDDGENSPATASAAALWRRVEGEQVVAQGISRVEFYRRAERATVLVRTGETLPYACYLLVKGVL